MRPVEKPWQLVRQKLDVCVTGRTSPGGAPGKVDEGPGPARRRGRSGVWVGRREDNVLRGEQKEVRRWTAT